MPDVRPAADRRVAELARAVLAALERVRSTTTPDGDADWAAFWSLTKAARDAEAILYETMIAGAHADGRFVAQMHLVNEAAVDLARRQAALLVVGVSRESQAAIRAATATALNARMNPTDLRRTIRSLVGLTPQQASAVVQYQHGLSMAAAGELTPAQVMGRWTLSPRVPGRLSGERMDALVQRYSERLLTARATNIARTETLRAAHQGQKALWDAARAEGLLPDDVKRVWQTTPDDRLCEACAPLDGVVIDYDGEFTTSRGNQEFTSETPPIHPNCRCTESLDFDG